MKYDIKIRTEIAHYYEYACRECSRLHTGVLYGRQGPPQRTTDCDWCNYNQPLDLERSKLVKVPTPDTQVDIDD